MLGDMFRYVSFAPVVPLVAAAGLSACSPASDQPNAAERQNNGKTLINKITILQNSYGHTSHIAEIYNEEIDDYKKGKIASRGNWGTNAERDDFDLQMELQSQLQKTSFGLLNTPDLIQVVSKNYSSKHYKEGNRAPLYRVKDFDHEVGPIAIRFQAEKNRVSAKCVVSYLSRSHNGEAWIKAFLHHDDDTRKITPPMEFKDDFIQFIRYHEFAHCMGADETQADMIAVKLMLLENPDKERTLQFAKIIMAIRGATAIYGIAEKQKPYYGTVMAINSAIEEFKAYGRIPLTRTQIWTQALDRHPAYADNMQPILERMKGDNIVISRDHAGMAALLRGITSGLKTDAQIITARTLADGADRLSRIVEDLPRVRTLWKPRVFTLDITLPVTP